MQTISLVTGASSGIGESICRELVEHDYRVIGAARNIEKLKELAIELGERFYPLKLDVNDRASVDSLLHDLPESFRDIDILINNAGHDIGGRQSFESASAEQEQQSEDGESFTRRPRVGVADADQRRLAKQRLAQSAGVEGQCGGEPDGRRGPWRLDLPAFPPRARRGVGVRPRVALARAPASTPTSSTT